MRNVDGMLAKDGRKDWATPVEFFARLDREFHFALDVCADWTNAKCDNYLTEEMNALDIEWGPGTCWMNPPYGRDLPQWIAKAYRESIRGSTVVCLVPARTDTAWWHDYVEGKAEVRFVRSRIRFVGAPFNAPFPSVVLIYRPQVCANAA